MIPAEFHGSVQELLSLPGLLELLLKATVVCLTALFLCAELERSAAAVKHRIALGAFICLALIPVLSWIVPPWHLTVLPRGEHASTATSWLNALSFAYIAIAAALALRLLLNIARIARVTRRASTAPRPWQNLLPPDATRHKITVKVSNDIEGPLTWGSLRPVVLLPSRARQWPAQDLQMVLQHEVAHVQRGDWLSQLLAHWVHSLFWPVPGIRALLRKLSLVAEQACDDRVLAAGEDPTDYAGLLLRQAQGQVIPAAVALGGNSELAVRVRYLVAEIVDRSKLNTQRHWTLLLCILLMVPLTSVHLAPQTTQYRLIPLYRSSTATDPSAAENTAITVVRPAPPPQVAEPPPPLEPQTPIAFPGDKPSIPPP